MKRARIATAVAAAVAAAAVAVVVLLDSGDDRSLPTPPSTTAPVATTRPEWEDIDQPTTIVTIPIPTPDTEPEPEPDTPVPTADPDEPTAEPDPEPTRPVTLIKPDFATISPTRHWPALHNGNLIGPQPALDAMAGEIADALAVWDQVTAFWGWYLLEGHGLAADFNAHTQPRLSATAADQLNYLHHRFWQQRLPAWEQVWADAWEQARHVQRNQWFLTNQAIWNAPDSPYPYRYWGPIIWTSVENLDDNEYKHRRPPSTRPEECDGGSGDDATEAALSAWIEETEAFLDKLAAGEVSTEEYRAWLETPDRPPAGPCDLRRVGTGSYANADWDIDAADAGLILTVPVPELVRWLQDNGYDPAEVFGGWPDPNKPEEARILRAAWDGFNYNENDYHTSDGTRATRHDPFSDAGSELVGGSGNVNPSGLYTPDDTDRPAAAADPDQWYQADYRPQASGALRAGLPTDWMRPDIGPGDTGNLEGDIEAMIRLSATNNWYLTQTHTGWSQSLTYLTADEIAWLASATDAEVEAQSVDPSAPYFTAIHVARAYGEGRDYLTFDQVAWTHPGLDPDLPVWQHWAESGEAEKWLGPSARDGRLAADPGEYWIGWWNESLDHNGDLAAQLGAHQDGRILDMNSAGDTFPKLRPPPYAEQSPLYSFPDITALTHHPDLSHIMGSITPSQRTAAGRVWHFEVCLWTGGGFWSAWSTTHPQLEEASINTTWIIRGTVDVTGRILELAEPVNQPCWGNTDGFPLRAWYDAAEPERWWHHSLAYHERSDGTTMKPYSPDMVEYDDPDGDGWYAEPHRLSPLAWLELANGEARYAARYASPSPIVSSDNHASADIFAQYETQFEHSPLYQFTPLVTAATVEEQRRAWLREYFNVHGGPNSEPADVYHRNGLLTVDEGGNIAFGQTVPDFDQPPDWHGMVISPSFIWDPESDIIAGFTAADRHNPYLWQPVTYVAHTPKTQAITHPQVKLKTVWSIAVGGCRADIPEMVWLPEGATYPPKWTDTATVPDRHVYQFPGVIHGLASGDTQHDRAVEVLHHGTDHPRHLRTYKADNYHPDIPCEEIRSGKYTPNYAFDVVYAEYLYWTQAFGDDPQENWTDPEPLRNPSWPMPPFAHDDPHDPSDYPLYHPPEPNPDEGFAPLLDDYYHTFNNMLRARGWLPET